MLENIRMQANLENIREGISISQSIVFQFLKLV